MSGGGSFAAQDTAPSCRPACALACVADPLTRFVLDDASPIGDPAWRLALALVGAPVPIDPPRWPAVFAEAEAAYGARTVAAALRYASRIPKPHGSPVPHERFPVLADRWQRHAEQSGEGVVADAA